MNFSLNFAATKKGFAVFGLISNIFVNKRSDFLALFFLTGYDLICTLVMLSVTPHGVYSRAASRISLSFC